MGLGAWRGGSGPIPNEPNLQSSLTGYRVTGITSGRFEIYEILGTALLVLDSQGAEILSNSKIIMQPIHGEHEGFHTRKLYETFPKHLLMVLPVISPTNQ